MSAFIRPVLVPALCWPFAVWLLWGAVFALFWLVDATLAGLQAVKERLADGIHRAISAIAGE